MSTLTERYVHAATRFVQSTDEREELRLELQERIDDTVSALRAEGHDAEEAERQALTDLGDPLLLSDQYRQRNSHLIGPRYFYTYVRVLLIAVCTSAPIVAVISALLEWSDGGDAGDVIGGGISAGLSIALHVAFWTTLVFAVLERVVPQPPGAWNPDMLPEAPGTGGGSRRSDMIASLVALAIGAVALVWQHLGSPVSGADGRIPILNPDLWVPWFVLLLVVLVVEAVHAVWLFRRGWTWAVATVNAVIAVAFAAIVVPLLLTHRVLNPELLEHLGWTGQTERGDVVAAAVILLITAWEVAAGFVRAARRPRGRRA
ncbi:permease prefix domain 1-containing protein [Pseudactinotalea terrae]|uniref:permease prefix domain 1-containing protein n=1 Tax=Pseudactinotalea terrae TaxID=1743262 RepID=UPI0012E21A7E|nr:permease prefix domain 1-containing protein [Pseudactinotalea terrae]